MPTPTQGGIKSRWQLAEADPRSLPQSVRRESARLRGIGVVVSHYREPKTNELFCTVVQGGVTLLDCASESELVAFSVGVFQVLPENVVAR